MRIFLTGILLIVFSYAVHAQRACSSFDYQQGQFAVNPSLKNNAAAIESFIQQKLTEKNSAAARGGGGESQLIVIPVVVHILYNTVHENISDQKVFDQLKVLNESFRRLNADTSNTPEWFRPYAADCNIEFKLATSGPRRNSTNGIIRKYTPVKVWKTDDKMKFSAETGSDAWDSESYLNIWVCNIGRTAGYSSFPGGPAEKDGIVLNHYAFGNNGHTGDYGMGKTAVHEAGHWLNLRHIWGDDYCGNDMVDDTPQQNNFTMGCPSGIRTSCSNKPNGDMYMNYMDVSADACTNMFTNGQAERMRALFEPGGVRNKLLRSGGLLPPLINEIPGEDENGFPKWSYANLYPNPSAANQFTLDLSYDARWIGKVLTITNNMGQTLLQVQVTGKVMTVPTGKLRAGCYFITGKKDDGATIRQKFIKL